MLATVAPTATDYADLVNLWEIDCELVYDGNQSLLHRFPAFFDDLARVLHRHGKSARFEVYLLHRHFPMFEDEVLVETLDREAGAWRLQVQPTAEVDRSAFVPVTFRFKTRERLLELVYTEAALTRGLDEGDLRCLDAFAAVVFEHGLENIVGVSLVHREPNGKDLQLFSEGEAGGGARVQVSVPVDAISDETGTIITHYRLIDDVWRCVLNCRRDSDGSHS